MMKKDDALVLHQPPTVARVTDWYASSRLARAVVAAIPTFGGPLDALLTGGANQRAQARIDDFIEQVGTRLQLLQSHVSAMPTDDELVDLTRLALARVASTRSSEKRQRFANVFVHQALCGAPVDQAEDALQLLDALTDLDVSIMTIALTRPHERIDDGLGVIHLRRIRAANAERPRRLLCDDLPDVPHTQLILSCARLTAHGLLVDEGTGRFDTGPLEVLAATDLARWFSAWICEQPAS